MTNFPQSIRFNPESNTYILGEYDELSIGEICVANLKAPC